MLRLSDYLALRLNELGIKHIFGVSDDYTNELIASLTSNQEISFVKSLNELSAAFSCDGYARINGIALLITSYGVGELTAFSGIAGAFAEFLPIIHIVVCEQDVKTNSDSTLHNLPDQSINSYSSCFKVASASTLRLNQIHTTYKLDSALIRAVMAKQPVYIELPRDLVNLLVKEPIRNLDLPHQTYDDLASITVIKKLIQSANKPLLILDLKTARYPELVASINNVIDNYNLPFMTTIAAKGILAETHQNYCGIYKGKNSSQTVHTLIGMSDLILYYFPYPVVADNDHTNFSLPKTKTMRVYGQEVYFNDTVIGNICAQILTSQLTVNVEKWWLNGNLVQDKIANMDVFTEDYFWGRVTNFLENNDVIVCDATLIQSRALEVKLPSNTKFICQSSWAAKGYCLPALMGGMFADAARRAILVISEESFLLGIQDLLLISLYGLKPIIFILKDTLTTKTDLAAKDVDNKWQIKYAAFNSLLANPIEVLHVYSKSDFDNCLIQLQKTNNLTLVEVDFSNGNKQDKQYMVPVMPNNSLSPLTNCS